MSMYPNPMSNRAAQVPAGYDVGTGVVARFMNMVYAWMCVGLATTAVVAWYTASSGLIFRLGMGTIVILFLVELALVWSISRSIQTMGATTATVLYLAYSAINGVVLSGVFVIYQLPALAGAFGITAGMFAAVSIYGFVTKRDLTSIGSFLFMALIGLIIASVVNIFVASSAFGWLINYAGVAIFLGLTAYDTQKLKEMSYACEGDEALASRLAISGALSLYLDFINLFLFILRIMGDRRR